ncbi:ABC transporter substrate-binding protein [uncultured Bosea sp.]|uniref:ABC transporter substrate-binding protein n=1 Tax=Bosea sp. NBC_00436 TaxID=2969620 RepID=A0A9E8CSN5_9HYPH|nr:ABC transporter substrate-binding protein [uncultured Bosea sp.]
MKLVRHFALGTAVAAMVAGWSGGAMAQETLTAWFTKGFYKGEDDALLAVVDKFQKATGVKVELSLYATEDCVTKSVGAVDAGTPPDVGFCTTYDFRTTGKWAYDGKLEDVSDVLEPLKGDIQPMALSTTFLMNGKAGKKSYYAFPVEQQMMHITYWKDMLEEAGFKEADIPKTWNGYWDFWCDKVQGSLRAKGKRIYGIGHPMGIAASDTFYSFLTFANAYNAKVVDENGKIVLDQPENKKAMVEAVKSYANIFQRGCTPPSSVNWLDPDNNVAFHNRTTVMTHNATISIAGKHMDDMNNPALTAEQRAQAKKNYEDNIRTAEFPLKADGSKMTNLAAVKTAVIFADAKNKKRAKEFMAFFMKDENLRPFVEGSAGRWVPTTLKAIDAPFWSDGKDPHRAVVYKQYKDGTVPFQFVYNYNFTTVNAENVWAKAVNRVVQDKIPAEQAVDEMIARIKQIAG